MKENMQRKTTFSLVSLGCAKNLVNSEQMHHLMREAGFVPVAEADGADLAIINTCGFIDAAKSEAIDCILEHAALKAEGRLGGIIVTGCLSERYQDEIQKELPEIDMSSYKNRVYEEYKEIVKRTPGIGSMKENMFVMTMYAGAFLIALYKEADGAL